MARWDIRPYSSEHGGHNRILHFQMGAGTTDTGEDTGWLEGYVMEINPAVGDIDPCVDGTEDPADGEHFIAAASSANLKEIHNVLDGDAAGIARIMVPVYDLYDGSEFATANVYNNSDTELALTVAGGVIPGVTADLWVDDGTATMAGHNHGLDINGNYFTITRVLDAQGRDAYVHGTTAVEVVFRRNI